MAANDSKSFTLVINQNEPIAMLPKSAYTLLWNGTDWVTTNTSIPIPTPIAPTSDEVVLDDGNGTSTEINIDGDISDPVIEIDTSQLPDEPASSDGNNSGFRLDNHLVEKSVFTRK